MASEPSPQEIERRSFPRHVHAGFSAAALAAAWLILLLLLLAVGHERIGDQWLLFYGVAGLTGVGAVGAAVLWRHWRRLDGPTPGGPFRLANREHLPQHDTYFASPAGAFAIGLVLVGSLAATFGVVIDVNQGPPGWTVGLATMGLVFVPPGLFLMQRDERALGRSAWPGLLVGFGLGCLGWLAVLVGAFTQVGWSFSGNPVVSALLLVGVAGLGLGLVLAARLKHRPNPFGIPMRGSGSYVAGFLLSIPVFGLLLGMMGA